MKPAVSVVLINKDDPAIEQTIEAMSAHAASDPFEIVVVDASAHRFDSVAAAYPDVRWIDFDPVPATVTIPQQRNTGVAAARAGIIAFTDASCLPAPGWLDRLLEPIRSGQAEAAAGRTTGRDGPSPYAGHDEEFLAECPTINFAVTRAAYDQIGGFDESFQYGSDVDFTWRLNRAGMRIRNVPGAVISHDWGSPRRRLRRAFQYGEARARLYAKHPWRIRRGLTQDPVVFAYSAYLLALPLTMLRPLRWLPALILVPLVKNRGSRPLETIADHLYYGAGALSFGLATARSRAGDLLHPAGPRRASATARRRTR